MDNENLLINIFMLVAAVIFTLSLLGAVVSKTVEITCQNTCAVQGYSNSTNYGTVCECIED